MIKKAIFFGTPILLIITLFFFLRSSNETIDTILEYHVKKDRFDIIVTTTGELQAAKSEEIKGPEGLRRVRIYNVKISDLISEGTIVDSGDFVASLDRTELSRFLKDNELEYQTVQNKIKSTELDTTLSLRSSREELINLKLSFEEARIKLEQSKFEPPASIRQAEINLTRSERSYYQAIENYKIKEAQAITQMKEVETQLTKVNQTTKDLLDIANQFTILAPKKGMVIYKKEWNGQKRKVGSEINPWDPVVATLPDMSQLISRAYINEVDISKIKMGQKAQIGIDAFPEKKFTGEVIKIANVGEQKPNSDAKVFEVQLHITQSDSTLKPAMTTSNQIYVNSFDSVLFVPIDAVFDDNNETVVYKKNNGSFERTPISTSVSNNNFIVVTKNLKDGDVLTLTRPK